MLTQKNGIFPVDAHYQRLGLAAVHIVVEGNAVAIIDTAHAASLTQVQRRLTELMLTADAVKYIILTHIHLDHAGGAAAYMEAFPQAKLVVHPKGVRHMLDPSKLQAGVEAVYGQEFVAKVYGKLQPIREERILVAMDGLSLNLNQRQLICYDTPGHANHHNIILDTKEQAIFSGDVFGVAYQALQVGTKCFTFPTTTPVNFDPVLMKESIAKILALNPEAIYRTHFGRATHPLETAAALLEMIDDYTVLAKQFAMNSNSVVQLEQQLTEYTVAKAVQFGVSLVPAAIQDIVAMDMQLNAQGLAVWANISK